LEVINKMKRNTYSDEFKEQVVHECQQIGNTALVARRHDISKHTVYAWIRKAKKNGSVRSLPKDKKKEYHEIKRRVNILGTENNQLKKLLAEKELELAILRDLRDQADPK